MKQLHAAGVRGLIYKCLFILVFSPVWRLGAQADSVQRLFAVIDTITLEGNHKTRPGFVLRELEFGRGDTLRISDLAQTLDRNALRLMNLSLFTSANIKVSDWKAGNHISLHIVVVESWYIYPVPIFSLADRNFNVWWNEFNRSLRRVNYGINWTQLNFTGRADQLKANLQFGYTNTYELSYNSPGINRGQTLGLQTYFSFNRAREVAVKTDGNKLVFRSNPDVWQIRRWYAGAGISWRPKLFAVHTLSLEYHQNQITDSLASEINPAFFGEGAKRQRHLSVVCNAAYDYRDIRPFPWRGHLAVLELRFNGLLPSDNLRLFRAKAEWHQYFPFSDKYSFEAIGKGRVTFPRRQLPYFNNQALGYGGDNVRGYEYYVADGLDFVLLKTTMRWKFLDRTLQLGKWMPMKAYKGLPLKLFFSFHNDLGRSNDPYFAANNPLTNRWLWGYGLGLNVVVYYDKVAKLEWSRNDLGASGFFLQINTGF